MSLNVASGTDMRALSVRMKFGNFSSKHAEHTRKELIFALSKRVTNLCRYAIFCSTVNQNQPGDAVSKRLETL